MSRRSRMSNALALVALVTGCGGGDFTAAGKTTGGATGTDGGVESGSGAASNGGSRGVGGSGTGSTSSAGGSGAAGANGTGGHVGLGGRRGSGGDGGTTGDGGATSAGGESNGGTTGSGGDVSSGGTNVGGVAGAGGVTGGGGASSGGMGVAGACTSPVAWYLDADQDGYGSSKDPKILSCDQPGPRYTKVGGDCNDHMDTVHPTTAQQAPMYHDQPYKAVDGTDSFDWDCSGAEEGDPGLPKAEASCPALSAGTCGGSGYLAVSTGNRVAANGYCGSKSYQKCVNQVALLCSAQTVTNFPTAYSCR